MAENVTLDELERHRRAWVEQQQAVIKANDEHAKIAELLPLGSAGGVSGTAEGWAVGVKAIEAEERMKWLSYQDALSRFQAQQADAQIRASNWLAKTNTWLAAFILLATGVQAFYAFKSFNKPDAPKCPDVIVGAK